MKQTFGSYFLTCLKVFFTMAIIPGLIFGTVPARAGGRDFTRDAIEKFMKTYHESRTTKDLLNRLSALGPTSDIEFLKKKAEEIGDRSLPVLTFQPDDTILIQADQHIIPLKFISIKKSLISLNNHTIDMSISKTPQERWDQLLKALPQSGKSALWDFLFPKASAIAGVDDALVGMMIWGAVTAAVSFTVHAYLNNEDKCKELGEGIDKCFKQIHLIKRYFKRRAETEADKTKKKTAKKDKKDKKDKDKKDKDKKDKKDKKKKDKDKDKDEDEDDKDDPDADEASWQEYLDSQKSGTCPTVPVNKDLDTETADLISEQMRALESTPTYYAWCQANYFSKDNRQDKVRTCIGELEKLSKQVCLNAAAEMSSRFKQAPPKTGLNTVK